MAAIDLRVLLEIDDDLDKKSSDALIRALKENHLSEFDYIKFKHSVNTLKNMSIDEATAYKSAFATAQTMGFTKEAFKKSVLHYRLILKKERERFADALKRQRSDKVSNQSEKVEEIKRKIQANQEKISKLLEENKILEDRLSNMDETIQKEREKLENITANFVKSFDFIDKRLEGDLQLFENYI